METWKAEALRCRLRLGDMRVAKSSRQLPMVVSSELPSVLRQPGCDAAVSSTSKRRRERRQRALARGGSSLVSPATTAIEHTSASGMLPSLHCCTTHGGSSSAQTFWNAFSAVEGSGLLGIPYALTRLGLIPGAVVLVSVAAASGFTANQLSEVAATAKENGAGGSPNCQVFGYEELAEVAYGMRGRRAAAVILYVELIGVVGIFLCLLATTLGSLGLAHLTAQTRVLLAAALTLPWLAVRDLKALARLSLLGVIALTVCLFGVLYDASAHGAAVTEQIAVPVAEKCEALGVVIFSYAAHGQFPNLRAGMSDPSRFSSVIVATFAAAAAVKLLFGLGAAFAYGPGGTPEMVLAAMAPGWKSYTCVGLVALNTLLRLPLPVFAASVVLERKGIPPFIARAVILAAATALAIGIPGFARLMGLVGLLTGAALVFVLPPLFELQLIPRTASTSMRRLLNFVMCVGGVIVGIGGFVASLLR